MLKLFGRPYPAVVAGKIEKFKFDFEEGVFKFSFTPRAAEAEEEREEQRRTIIAVNEEEVLGYGKWIVVLQGDDAVGKIRVEREERKVSIIVPRGWSGMVHVLMRLAKSKP